MTKQVDLIIQLTQSVTCKTQQLKMNVTPLPPHLKYNVYIIACHCALSHILIKRREFFKQGIMNWS